MKKIIIASKQEKFKIKPDFPTRGNRGNVPSSERGYSKLHVPTVPTRWKISFMRRGRVVRLQDLEPCPPIASFCFISNLKNWELYKSRCVLRNWAHTWFCTIAWLLLTKTGFYNENKYLFVKLQFNYNSHCKIVTWQKTFLYNYTKFKFTNYWLNNIQIPICNYRYI